MPELPEVETIVRAFRPRLEGRTIRTFDTSWPRSVQPNVEHARAALVGRTVQRLHRRGKWIVFDLVGGGHMLVHLRMSGRFEMVAGGETTPRFARTQWGLDDGRVLLLCDSRKFGRVQYVHDLESALADLGPEPLARTFTANALGDILRSRDRQLKPLLLDQTVIAGLGNIYVDEALFRAELHPLRVTRSLRPYEIERLHGAIRAVLRNGIRRNGTTIDWVYLGGRMQEYLRVYGRTGLPCTRCGTPIKALRVAQRGTHICPTCQPRPRRRTRRRPARTASQKTL